METLKIVVVAVGRDKIKGKPGDRRIRDLMEVIRVVVVVVGEVGVLVDQDTDKLPIRVYFNVRGKLPLLGIIGLRLRVVDMVKMVVRNLQEDKIPVLGPVQRDLATTISMMEGLGLGLGELLDNRKDLVRADRE